MQSSDEQERQAIVKGLINLALIEGFILMLVVSVYLYTNNFVYLVGGLVGWALITAPMLFRFMRDHRAVPKSRSYGCEND